MLDIFQDTSSCDNSVGYRDGYRKQQQFIVAPLPEYGKEDDMLDLIMENQMQVIVILRKNSPRHSEEMNYYWIPQSESSHVRRRYKITLTDFQYREKYTSIGLKIQRRQLVNICHCVRVLYYNNCDEDGVPLCTNDFIHLVHESFVANSVDDSSMPALKPIVVHSNGDESLAGVYCVIAISMFKLWYEGRDTSLSRCSFTESSTPCLRAISELQFGWMNAALIIYSEKLYAQKLEKLE